MKYFNDSFSHGLFLIHNNSQGSDPSSATFFGQLSEAPMSIFYFHFEIKLEAYLYVKFPLKCPCSIYSRANYKMCLTHGMQRIYCVQMETFWNCTQIKIAEHLQSFCIKYRKAKHLMCGCTGKCFWWYKGSFQDCCQWHQHVWFLYFCRIYLFLVSSPINYCIWVLFLSFNFHFTLKLILQIDLNRSYYYVPLLFIYL